MVSTVEQDHGDGNWGGLTGVRKDSATNRARAFNCNCVSLVPLHTVIRSNTHKQLHLRDLLVDLLHKLNDEVDKLVLQHFLSVEVCYQEGDIITLQQRQSGVIQWHGMASS